MRPGVWRPPVELSASEAAVVRRIKRAKLFVFLRQWRHLLFDSAFRVELATLYTDAARGQPPVPPAQLALATLLQASTGASDDEVVEATVMDRRWQLVLDCLDTEAAPFSKGTLVAFRQRLIAAEGDRRLIERTVDLAQTQAGPGPRQLRAALDSSPLWGAGRVEDTYNLLGHALRKAVGVLARQPGWELPHDHAADRAGPDLHLLAGTSLKAALDLDRDDPAARQVALHQVLRRLDPVEGLVAGQVAVAPVDQPPHPPLVAARAAVAVAQAIHDQDLDLDATGQARLAPRVAPERRISVEDGQMRHGRKSRARRVDGDKRHVVRDLDTGLVRAVGLTPANAPEASVTPALAADLGRQPLPVAEWHLDRAYLSRTLVRERAETTAIFCKAWPVRNGPRFPKTAFTLDWGQHTLRCPAGTTLPFTPGGTVRFPRATCAACAQRDRCTTSAHGRSVGIHPDERLLTELRRRQTTSAGRATLRQRVAVEHALAHLGHWQGDRARYVGQRQNLFDLRRCAVVHNLHVLARSPTAPAA